jgi:protein-S-isoprenylcysteine O-methyltransferase Ste14
MVNTNDRGCPSPARLAGKMAVYTVSFLPILLGGVPYALHQLGRLLYPDSVHAWLSPGLGQHVLGAVVFALGLAGYLVCSMWLVIVGKGPFVEFDPPTQFVATGPYRWMRNPVAALLIMTVLGEAVYFGSPGIATLVLISPLLAHLQVTRIEEPRLRARFGEPYEDYCRRVPRWLPRRPEP